MGISYKKLCLMLVEKGISPATLRKNLCIATGIMTKLRRNEEIALSLLLRICECLDCNSASNFTAEPSSQAEGGTVVVTYVFDLLDLVYSRQCCFNFRRR